MPARRAPRKAPQPPGPTQPADAAAFLPFGENVHLSNYLEDLRLERGKIEFVGLPALIDTSAPVAIDQLFVEPAVSEAPLSPEAFDDGKKTPSTHRLVETLCQHQRLVLLGDPGMGKSTVVNWLCESLAAPAGSVLRQRLGPLIPLPFILRDLALDARITWPKLLKAFHTQSFAGRWKRAQTQLDRLLKSGQCLLLFDGIDELGSISVREALRRAIWQAMDLFPRCRFLLTSRVVGYEEVEFNVAETTTDVSIKRVDGESPYAEICLPGKEPIQVYGENVYHDPFDDASRLAFTFAGDAQRGGSVKKISDEVFRVSSFAPVATRLTLAPFTDDQIEDFARHWWRVHRGGKAKADSDVKDFLRALRGSPGTGTLARIPNLLTLIALVYKTFIQLPDGRADLYQRIAQAYLENIDRHYGLPLPFPHQEMARWLGVIAWHLQLRRFAHARKAKAGETVDLFASRDEVLRWLRDAIRVQHGEKAAEIAKAFLHFVDRRSGLFLPRGEDRYGFLHLSFLEYFAAQHLAEAIGSEDWWEAHAHHGPAWEEEDTALPSLRRYAGHRLWRETFIFLFELLCLKNTRLPTRRLRLLLSDDVPTPGWSELRAPFPHENKPTPPPEQTTVATVELAAVLSVNLHITFTDTERRGLWARCWDWELARQEAGKWNRSSSVPPLLTSRSSCVEAVLTELEGRSLANLLLSYCTSLTDLTPLSGLSTLQSLFLAGCTGLSDLAPLAKLSCLRILVLSRCTGLSDLAPLAKLSCLEALLLDGCTGLSDLAPLAKLSCLRTLGLYGCIGLSKASLKVVEGLRTRGCQVIGP